MFSKGSASCWRLLHLSLTKLALELLTSGKNIYDKIPIIKFHMSNATHKIVTFAEIYYSTLLFIFIIAVDCCETIIDGTSFLLLGPLML